MSYVVSTPRYTSSYWDPDTEINPKTGYSIKTEGPTWQKLYNTDAKVLNTETGNWVYADGQTGQREIKRSQRQGYEPIYSTDLWGFDVYYPRIRPVPSRNVNYVSSKDALKLSSDVKRKFLGDRDINEGNKSCSEDDRKKCSDKLEGLILGPVLGEGNFGTVHFAKAKSSDGRSAPIMLKVMYFDDSTLENMKIEVAFAKFMAEQKMGPEVLDSFYYKRGGGYEQVIVMAGYDMNIGKMVKEYNYREKDRVKGALEKAAGLLHTQVYKLGMFCFSVKPINFLYSETSQEVRYIDFGAYFCEKRDSGLVEGQSQDIANKNAVYHILLCQLSIGIKRYYNSPVSGIFGEMLPSVKENVDLAVDTMYTFFHNEPKAVEYTFENTGIRVRSKGDVKRLLRDGTGIGSGGGWWGW